MIAVTVDFKVKKESIEVFQQAIMLQASNSLNREETCRQFDVCNDPSDASHIFLYEVYDNQAAFEVHLATEHFAQFDEQTKDWIASKSIAIWQIAT